MPSTLRGSILAAVVAAVLAAGCAGPTRVTYQNATPGKPEAISATVTRPTGPGPFPAVVIPTAAAASPRSSSAGRAGSRSAATWGWWWTASVPAR
jgi:hypothetical protein